MEILTLWPLSQGELASKNDAFVDTVFGSRLPGPPGAAVTRADLIARIVAGGYPEVMGRAATGRRAAWYGSYVNAILQRDVRDLANVADLAALPRLLALLASRPMALLNAADLARTIGLPQTTLKRYLALLEATFLVRLLPPWFVNIGRRLGKSPKVFLCDTGLAAHLAGLGGTRLADDPSLLGGLLENFIVMELQKQAGWSRVKPALRHFRSHDGREVDIVLEEPGGGRVVGIEVKASAAVGPDDFRGLHLLAEAAGRRFHRGMVLYTGAETVPFGRVMHAVPAQAVWAWV
jgi:predicted AAA+ superfamily ATPase